MTKTKALIDSSLWIAFIDKSDSYHQKAKKILNKNAIPHFDLFTSDFVLNECLTRIRKKVDAKSAFLFYDLILKEQKNQSLKILYTTKEIFTKAYKIFKANSTPKKLSFTDTSLVAQMKTYKIKTLLSFDRDFKKIKPKIRVIP